MNKQELRSMCTDSQFLTQFTEAYSLSMLLSNCIISPGYEVSIDFENSIVLTEDGQRIFEKLISLHPDYPKAELLLSIFVAFSHDNLFIDIMNTNIDGLKKIINREILNNSIKYPWVYERTIYDQFSSLRSDRPEWLSYDEAIPILQNIPTGVFQVNKYIVGPFGLLESTIKRFLPPTRNAPLWHCSDPACERVHFVSIRSGDHNLLQLSSDIMELCKSTKKSEWLEYFIDDCSGQPEWFDEKHLDQLPYLLINCFSKTEIKHIFINLLDTYPEKVRSKLPKRVSQNGSAVRISETLDTNHIFQLVLLMTNEEIADSIEELIISNTIKIPPTELRTSRFFYKPLSAYDIICQCSCFGVRAIPQNINISTILLKNLINELYNDEKELEWKLRHCNGEGNTEKLEWYLNNTDPRSIISEFILSSQFYTSRAFKYLGCGKFSLPKTKSEEEFLIEKILWKLGFDIGIYPNDIPLYWERLNKFCDSSRIHSSYTEQDKEVIRSTGVNFFVSLEQILDYALSFSTWLLFSDHFERTEFKFNLKVAQRFAADFLNSTQIDHPGRIIYETNGKNTLFPLIQGFDLLAKQITQALEEKERYIRPTSDYPGFSGRSKIRIYPYLHNILLLDIRPEDIKKTIILLESVTREYNKFDICSIRNKIEHKRDDFPNAEEIEKACSTLIRVTREMQEAGILPTIYLYSGKHTDKFGRGYDKLENYEGKTIEIFHQSQFRLKTPSKKVAQIIVPSIRIDNSVEPIRIAYKEESEYVKMWSDFPKIRENLKSDSINKTEGGYGNKTIYQIEESIG